MLTDKDGNALFRFGDGSPSPVEDSRDADQTPSGIGQDNTCRVSPSPIEDSRDADPSVLAWGVFTSSSPHPLSRIHVTPTLDRVTAIHLLPLAYNMQPSHME